jgi:hypothetical protein
MRQRERLKLKQTTKIEIINEFFTTEPNSTGCSSCNGNTPSPELTTLYLDPEEAQAELTASNVRHMLGVLDELSGTPADSEDDLDGSDTDSVNDRLAL